MKKNIFNKSYIKYGLIFAAGLFIGWLIFGGSSEKHMEHVHEESVAQVWTCSMHPQIKQAKPGKCPLCAMDLIPLKTSDSGSYAVAPEAIQLSKEAIALANIETTVIGRGNPVKEIQLYGTIQVDERLSQSQTSHVNGRIEELSVNFTGENVRKGQTIATIYSPELLSAQQELLEASNMQPAQPALVQAARDKLRLMKLTNEQIAKIEQSGKASALVEIKANTNGIVVDKKVNKGDYINQGSVLFDIADLSKVWSMFDAYEVDLPFLKVGDKIDFTLQAIPGKIISGKISFIDPMLDATTRTAKVRVETANQGMQLKPGMYANASITTSLKQYENEIVIPKSAVLWTGKRSIVYVKQPNTETPAFMLHEVDLGPSLGDSYVVLSGLNEGDEIVTNGTFIVDASAQLEGKRSMMNTEASHSAMRQEGHEMTAQGEHATITAQGLCGMCKERIEKAAKSVKGVVSASWDLETRVLHITFEPSKSNVDAVSKAVAKVGHDTDKYKTDKAVYNALPACCKYRD